ncbi:hypothetical protein [Pseudoduganella namucuonensis]|nr:hypothetical protein [Pseudoduganella namucuonensis]
MNAKTTATDLPKTTNDQKPALPAVATAPQTVAPASPSAAGPIKNASTPISSTPTADMTGTEGKSVTADSPAAKPEKKPKPPTKMEIASSIYLRMSAQKDMTRKQIVEQFVAEAKLSAAGASTYYQLIKAKLG